jgi:tetratricopeptide (TPR) repeat protein
MFCQRFFKRIALSTVIALGFVEPARSGSCLFDTGLDAIASCSLVIEQNVNDPAVVAAALRKRGVEYFELSKYREAIGDLEKVISTANADANDWYIRGASYSWLDEWELAVKDYEVANERVKGREIYMSDFASALKETGKYKRAESILNELIVMQPANPTYFSRRGYLRLDAGNLSGAIDDFAIAIAYDPNVPAFWIGRGDAYYWKSRVPRALKYYDRAILIDPKNRQARYARARAYRYDDNFKAALDDLTAVIANTPDADAYLDRASTYIYANDLQAAKNDIASAGVLPNRAVEIGILRGRMQIMEGNNAGAAVIFETLLKEKGKSANVDYWLASTYQSLNENQKAYDAYSRLIDAWPTDEGVLVSRAGVLTQLRRWGDAHKDVSAALLLRPDNEFALDVRAKIFNAENIWRDAVNASNQSIAINPGRSAPYDYRAYSQWNLNFREDAVSDYRKSLRLDPNYGQSHADLAEVLAELKRFKEAHSEIDEALRLEPKYSRHQISLGRVYEYEGLSPDARKAYLKAVEMDPDDWWGYDAMAWLELSERNFVESERYCSLILLKEFPIAATYRCLARIRVESDDNAAALALLDKAVKLDPQYGAGYYDRGRIYFRESKFEDARDAFTLAIEINYRLAESLTYRGDAFHELGLDIAAIKDFRRAQEIGDHDLGPFIVNRLARLNASQPASLEDGFGYPQNRSRRN